MTNIKGFFDVPRVHVPSLAAMSCCDNSISWSGSHQKLCRPSGHPSQPTSLFICLRVLIESTMVVALQLLLTSIFLVCKDRKYVETTLLSAGQKGRLGKQTEIIDGCRFLLEILAKQSIWCQGQNNYSTPEVDVENSSKFELYE